MSQPYGTPNQPQSYTSAPSNKTYGSSTTPQNTNTPSTFPMSLGPGVNINYSSQPATTSIPQSYTSTSYQSAGASSTPLSYTAPDKGLTYTTGNLSSNYSYNITSSSNKPELYSTVKIEPTSYTSNYNYTSSNTKSSPQNSNPLSYTNTATYSIPPTTPGSNKADDSSTIRITSTFTPSIAPVGNVTSQTKSQTSSYSQPGSRNNLDVQPQVVQQSDPRSLARSQSQIPVSTDVSRRVVPPAAATTEDQFSVKKEVATQSLENRSTGSLRSFEDFLNLRTQMGFHLLNTKDAVLAIRERVGHIRHLSLDEFIMVFTELFRGKFANFYEFVDKLSQLFQFVDTNNNGYLEMGECLQAFIHLFGGSEEDKIRAAFYLFDVDNSGFLDHDEIYTMIYNTIRLHEHMGEDLKDEEEQKIAKIAKATSEDLFKAMDLDGDQKISLEEFLVWYRSFGTGGVKAEDLEDAKKMREAKVKDLLRKGVMIESHDHNHDGDAHEAYHELNEAQAFTKFIDDVRKQIAFDRVHVHLAVHLLQEMYPDMTCNYAQFVEFLEKLVKQNRLGGGENINGLAKKLFNAFDDNKNGLLDISEIVTGLSLLCGGSAKDKLQAAFELFDQNHDKVLDFHEANRLMRAFFKFMRTDTPYLKLQNGSIDNYALALTHKLFEEVNIPEDQGIPFKVFEGWASSISKA